MTAPRSGAKRVLDHPMTGWAVVALVVIAWDALSAETLTGAFGKAREAHPVADAAVIVAWAALTGHLLGVLPRQADPFAVLTIPRTLRAEERSCLSGRGWWRCGMNSLVDRSGSPSAPVIPTVTVVTTS